MADMSNRLLPVRSVLALTIVFGLAVTLGAWQAASLQAVQAPAKDAVAGVRNFTKVDSTIACGGALSPEAFASLKQAGYKSIVNLRAASEQGANVEDEQKAAKEAGLKYIHLPFASASPDGAKVDEFLAAVVLPENQPMLLHCASGGRASMFWAVKRVMIDAWPVDKAMSELPDLAKNVGEPVRAFMLEYLKSHGKTRP
jgi:uncharacterized protein (TIGR01244 family)